MPGPRPKAQRLNSRDQMKAMQREKFVRHDGKVRGPEPRAEWKPQTTEWWNTWRVSPQAQLFVDTDWQMLLILAEVVNNFYMKPSAALATEVRLGTDAFGATYASRVKNRITVEADSEEFDIAPVTPLVSRREAAKERLKGAGTAVAQSARRDAARAALQGADVDATADDPAPF